MHKWRSEESAILVGTNTVLADDPLLTNRLWSGKSPVRLLIDKDLKLPGNANVFNNDAPTIVFNLHKTTIDLNADLILDNQIYYYQVEYAHNIAEQIIKACYKLKLQSVFVEGGSKLLQSFSNENLFDQIRVITNQDLAIENGMDAPGFNSVCKV